MNDYVDRFVGIIHDFYDGPEVFMEAAGYFVVSATLGRFFRLPQAGGMRPNIWIVLSSIPGALRRSTLQKYAMTTYRSALERFYSEIKKEPEEEIGKLIDDTIIEEGTPEGIADHINHTALDSYAIFSTEFGGVLTKIYEKGSYERGVGTLFSKLYYGEAGTVYLSRRGGRAGIRRIRPGLYVTMFAGMQEPRYYLTQDMIRQGLLRRILIIYFDVREKNRWVPPLMDGRDEVYDNLKELGEELGERMLEFYKKASGLDPPLMEVILTPRVLNSINSYAEELDKKITRDPSDANIYLQSLWEHLAKLSTLRAIARGNLVEEWGVPTINVEDEDLERAKSFLREATSKAKDIIDDLGFERRKPISYEEPIERIYRTIAEAGEEGIKRSDLLRKNRWCRADDLDRYLGTLIQQGRIERLESTAEGPGRLAVRYRAID